MIRVNNTSGQTVRIPDHELRVKTAEGTVYTLRASSSNVRGVQPDAEVELTYMKVVNRQTEVSLTDRRSSTSIMMYIRSKKRPCSQLRLAIECGMEIVLS